MLKKILLCTSILLISYSSVTFASHYVRGYSRSNGTYVESHRSMDPGESRDTGLSYHDNELVPRDY